MLFAFVYLCVGQVSAKFKAKMFQPHIFHRSCHNSLRKWASASYLRTVQTQHSANQSRSYSERSASLTDNKYYRDIKESFSNFTDIKNSPPPALVLGVSGLIPFVSIPAHMLSSGVFIPELAYASLAYGATILSFLGGCRWGLTVQHPQANTNSEPNWCNLTWSVTPSLIAWSSLLVPHCQGTALVIAGLSAALAKDLVGDVYPQWFKSLRILLTTVAVLALTVTFACSLLLPAENKTKTNH